MVRRFSISLVSGRCRAGSGVSKRVFGAGIKVVRVGVLAIMSSVAGANIYTRVAESQDLTGDWGQAGMKSVAWSTGGMKVAVA